MTHPTNEMRWHRHLVITPDGPTDEVLRHTLQQKWAVMENEGATVPDYYEWRDVPIVDQFHRLEKERK